MTPHTSGGPAPARDAASRRATPPRAYRLAPDDPSKIAADLARLAAPGAQPFGISGQLVPAMGIPMAAESTAPALNGARGLASKRRHADTAPAACRDFRQTGAQAEAGIPASLAEPLRLPPAPLPSMRTALARRAAVFGPVVVVTPTTAEIAQAEPAPRPAPAGKLPPSGNLTPAELLASIAREIDGGRP